MNLHGKAITFVCAALFLAVRTYAVTGYYSVSISAGDNLIANQVSASPDNTLDNVLYSGVATGSTFTEWDPTSNQLLPVSVYDGSAWSINYTFGPNGTGGVLNSPVATSVTFAGTLVNYDVNTGDYTYVPASLNPGVYLLAFAAPVTMPPETFQEIAGRAPIAGDAVKTLDPATQTYSTTTFNGSTWNNGAPVLGIGQAAYFQLAEVPEPSTYALMLGCGAAVLTFRRRISSRR